MLTREQILQSQDLKIRKVLTPEWGEGGFVFVRSLTNDERDQWEATYMVMRSDPKNGTFSGFQFRKERMKVQLLVRTVCDEQGVLLFNSASDIETLAGKNAAPVNRCFDTACELSGFTKTDLDDLAKN